MYAFTHLYSALAAAILLFYELFRLSQCMKKIRSERLTGRHDYRLTCIYAYHAINAVDCLFVSLFSEPCRRFARNLFITGRRHVII